MENVKPTIFETFIKYTVLFYLLLIIDGYLSDLCFYSFFGIPIRPYFTIEDYINEFFRNWPFSLLIAVTYFILVSSFKFSERMNNYAGAIKIPKKISVKIIFLVLIIGLFVSFLILFIALQKWFIKLSGSIISYVLIVIPVVVSSLLYFILNDGIIFKSSNMSRNKVLLISSIVFLISMKLTLNIDFGYRSLNSKITELNVKFYFKSGTIIANSDSVVYLGSSKDYLFLYNRLHRKALIYNRSELMYSEIDKERKRPVK
jgi:hypothetical protein